MNVKSIKKGFTLTELIIVIVIIGILAGVLIPTFINVVNKANKAADLSLIRNLNEALVLDKYDNGEHKYMAAALDAAEDYGFEVEKIDAKVSKNKILWDSKNDVFCYLVDNKLEYYPKSVKDEDALDPTDPDEKYLLWIIASTPSDEYSTYLYKTAPGASFTGVKTGIDVGKEDISSIEYVGVGTKQDVVIHTTSAKTSIVVNAPYDIVTHYGAAGFVDIIKVANASYHENGSVAFLEISKGRVVLETESQVTHIHVTTKVNYVDANTGEKNKTADTFDQVVVALADGVDAPEFSRDEVSFDAINDAGDSGILVVEIEKENDQSDFIYLYQQGLVEQIRVTSGVSTATSTPENVVVSTPITSAAKLGSDDNLEANTSSVAFDIANSYNGQKAGEYTLSDSDVNVDGSLTTEAANNVTDTGLEDNAKKDVKAETVETAKDSFINGSSIRLIYDNQTTEISLSDFRNLVNNGEIDGCTAILIKDTDLSEISTWKPIGTIDHPFIGVFDGQNHSITGLQIEEPESNYQGLFGVIGSSSNSNAYFDELSDIWNDSTHVLSESAISEDKYNTVVKNLNVSSSISGNLYVGGVIAYARNSYIYNVELVSGSTLATVAAENRVGGIVGEIDRVVIKSCRTGDGVTLKGGNIGGITGFLAYTPDRDDVRNAIIDCENNASIIFNSLSGYRPMGGIIGYATGGEGIVISNCSNTGSLTNESGQYPQAAAGIAGYSHSVVLFDSCTNSGTIDITRTLYHNETEDAVSTSDQCGIGGISGCGTVVTKYYNCENSASLTGLTRHLAGISGWVNGSKDTSGYENGYIANCVNTGSLSNTLSSQNSEYKKDDLANYRYDNMVKIITILAGNYATVSELQAVVNQSNALQLDFTSVVVSNTSGTLVLPNLALESVTIPVKVADTIRLQNAKDQIQLTASNVTIEIDGDFGGNAKRIELISSKATIVVNEGATLGGMKFTCDNSISITIVNRGTINGKYWDETFNCKDITGGKFVINNYGTIVTPTNDNGTSAKSLTNKFDNVDFELYLYQGSRLYSNISSSFVSSDLHKSVVFKAYNIGVGDDYCINNAGSFARIKKLDTSYQPASTDSSLTSNASYHTAD